MASRISLIDLAEATGVAADLFAREVAMTRIFLVGEPARPPERRLPALGGCEGPLPGAPSMEAQGAPWDGEGNPPARHQRHRARA
jgi:hypothetical protein